MHADLVMGKKTVRLYGNTVGDAFSGNANSGNRVKQSVRYLDGVPDRHGSFSHLSLFISTIVFLVSHYHVSFWNSILSCSSVMQSRMRGFVRFVSCFQNLQLELMPLLYLLKILIR